MCVAGRRRAGEGGVVRACVRACGSAYGMCFICVSYAVSVCSSVRVPFVWSWFVTPWLVTTGQVQ